MIVAIIGILAGSLGLVSILDTVLPGNLTEWFISGIWSVLQYLITPIVKLFTLIFDSVCSIIRSFFFS